MITNCLIPGQCFLVLYLLRLDFLGKVLLQEIHHGRVEIRCFESCQLSRYQNNHELLTYVGFHYDLSPAQRTVLAPRPLHYNQTANAEDMAASQSNRLVCYVEAHRTEVIVQMWNPREHVLGQFEANSFRHGLCQKRFSRYEFGKLLLYTQRSAFIEFCTN